MPRFLTPARVCLLVALEVYTQDTLPTLPTQSALALLDLISQHVVSIGDSPGGDVQEKCAFASSDITYFADRLRLLPSNMPGRSVYDLLVVRLWQFNSVDSLHDFTETMSHYRIRPSPSRDPFTAPSPAAFTAGSPFGQHIRRCWVEFTRLQFEDAEALWKAFVAYREPSHRDWEVKNQETAVKQLEEVNVVSVPSLPRPSDGESALQSGANAAVVDADTLLHFTIQRLQKEGTRIPADVKARVEQWIGDQMDSNTQSLHFFMAFFDHWRAGQYTMALENLHRYFDYSLAGKSATDNMRVHYQYALLHLSVLHADFECWGESVDAMNECIATG